MPELPEVESVRRALAGVLIGSVAERRVVYRRDVVRGPASPRAMLVGARVSAVARRGKHLAVLSAEGPCLDIHLGMSGKVLLSPAPGTPRPPHTHVEWTFAGALKVRFVDPRRFGGVWTFRTSAELERMRWGALGPEADTVTPTELAEALAGRRSTVKSALLDQHTLAGLGNIYADEALFRAKLHPFTPAGRISKEQIRSLAQGIRSVLRAALRAGGSTIKDYQQPDGSEGAFRRSVYGCAGRACPRCSASLTTARCAGRSTTWCPECQPAPSP